MRVNTRKSIQSFFRAEADKLKRKRSALMWETLSIGCYPHTQQEGDRQGKDPSGVVMGCVQAEQRYPFPLLCHEYMYVYVRKSEGDSVFLWLLPPYLGQALDRNTEEFSITTFLFCGRVPYGRPSATSTLQVYPDIHNFRVVSGGNLLFIVMMSISGCACLERRAYSAHCR